MVLVKILKRRDASSVIVAVVIATIIGQALMFMTGDLASRIAGTNQGDGQFSLVPTGGVWKQTYLYPVVWAALEIIALEILAWIVVSLESAFKSSAKKSSKK